MSVVTDAVSQTGRNIDRSAGYIRRSLSSRFASLAAVVIALMWTVPTVGLLITSFRPPLDINKTGWWTVVKEPTFTVENYVKVWNSKANGIPFYEFLTNTFIIVIPSVVIPITIASLAAYAFAWTRFRGRNVLFIAVFALQIVPIQVTLWPLLQLYSQTGLLKGFWAVWFSHSIFALPLAIFLLHNFMREIPGELIEAARVDGCGHARIFVSIILPLMRPALAAFGIFQFLWVWNDLLVALTFASSTQTAPVTLALSNMTGSRGSMWFLSSAGAFMSMVIPVIIFLSLQRYFVRGLLAGSVKG